METMSDVAKGLGYCSETRSYQPGILRDRALLALSWFTTGLLWWSRLPLDLEIWSESSVRMADPRRRLNRLLLHALYKWRFERDALSYRLVTLFTRRNKMDASRWRFLLRFHINVVTLLLIGVIEAKCLKTLPWRIPIFNVVALMEQRGIFCHMFSVSQCECEVCVERDLARGQNGLAYPALDKRWPV